MYLARIAEPEEFPVTLDEVKAHARIEISEDNILLDGLIRAATDYAEWYTQRALCTQEWEARLDCFPQSGRFEIPRPPLQELIEINYLAPNGDETALDSGLYTLVESPTGKSLIALKSGKLWPSISRDPLGVVFRWRAGYGTEEHSADLVPDGIKLGIQMLVAEYYENRESTVLTGAVIQEVPFNVQTLLWPFVVDKLGI